MQAAGWTLPSRRPHIELREECGTVGQVEVCLRLGCRCYVRTHSLGLFMVCCRVECVMWSASACPYTNTGPSSSAPRSSLNTHTHTHTHCSVPCPRPAVGCMDSLSFLILASSCQCFVLASGRRGDGERKTLRACMCVCVCVCVCAT